MLERPRDKLDTDGFITVDQLDLGNRLAEKADAVGSPPDLRPDAALRNMLHTGDLYSVIPRCDPTSGHSCGSHSAGDHPGLAGMRRRALDVDQGILQGSPALGPDPSRIKARETWLPSAAAPCWSPHVEEEGEVSGVKKKDSMLSFAVDARWSNRMCRPPPYSRLAVLGPCPALRWGVKWICLRCLEPDTLSGLTPLPRVTRNGVCSVTASTFSTDFIRSSVQRVPVRAWASGYRG